RVEVLSPGVVAGFIATGPTAAPTILRLITVPSFVKVGEGVAGGISPVLLQAALPLQSQSTPIALTLSTTQSWPAAAGWVVLASQRQEPQFLPSPHFAS